MNDSSPSTLSLLLKRQVFLTVHILTKELNNMIWLLTTYQYCPVVGVSTTEKLTCFVLMGGEEDGLRLDVGLL